MSLTCVVCGALFVPKRRSTAKTCSRKCSHKRWRDANRDYVNRKSREWVQKNLDSHRQYMRAYSKQHRALNLERAMFNAAKKRARLKGLDFDIDLADIKIPDRCPVSGVALGVDQKRQTSPSLDRIDPVLGYVKGNVRVISNRMNKIKADASLDELKALVAYMEAVA